MRAEPLVGRAGERVAAERGDVEAAVRRGVHGVDVDARAGVVRGGDDPARGRGSVPTALEACGHRDPARALREHRLDRRSPAARASPARARRSARSRRRARRAITHGRTLASWSRRVQTISSPGSSVRPTAPAKAIVSAVMLEPKTISARRRAEQRAGARARRRDELVGRVRGRERAAVVGAAAGAHPGGPSPRSRVSTICVPAGPVEPRPAVARGRGSARGSPMRPRLAHELARRAGRSSAGGVGGRAASGSRRPRRWASNSPSSGSISQ